MIEQYVNAFTILKSGLQPRKPNDNHYKYYPCRLPKVCQFYCYFFGHLTMYFRIFSSFTVPTPKQQFQQQNRMNRME